MEYIEDCFKDLEKPKFGWRVKVILKEEEPCDLNIENPSLSTCGFNSNPASKKSDSDYLTHFAQNRQTGEGFRSVAPPDCRLVLFGSKHFYDLQYSKLSFTLKVNLIKENFNDELTKIGRSLRKYIASTNFNAKVLSRKIFYERLNGSKFSKFQMLV